MKFLYKLEHKHLTAIDFKTNEKIFDTKVLGFFSSEDKCKSMIAYYLQQSGFKDFPNDFVIHQIEADIDDFCDVSGEFESSVFYLSHEYFDGEFDYISNLGYYSTYEIAQIRRCNYQFEPKYANYPDGFCIDEYEINKPEWLEGFFTYT